MPTLSEAIDQATWSQALTDKERWRVEAETVVRTIPKDGLVCMKGEPAKHWIGVIDGLVKVATTSPSGKLATFSGVPTGGWIGEGSLLKDDPRYYDVIALRESTIAYVPRAVFLWLMDHNPRFVRFLVTQLNARLAQAMAIIEAERLRGSDGRVAHCLANLYNPTLYPGITTTLRISQEEIGLIAGISRQRVNQALRVLQEKNLLRVENFGITIVDPQQLRSFER